MIENVQKLANSHNIKTSVLLSGLLYAGVVELTHDTLDPHQLANNLGHKSAPEKQPEQPERRTQKKQSDTLQTVETANSLMNQFA